MKKSNFIKSTLLLIFGGFITKILGMIIKIVLTRTIGVKAIGLYMMIMPTYTLLISLATFGFPIAISKLVSEDKYNNKKLVLGIIPISIIIDLIILIFLIFFSKFLSINLLHNEKTYLGLISIGFVLPFISISSILRGYFFGKEYIMPHIISNILEDIIRLIIIILFIPFIMPYGIEYTISFLILSSILCELSSIIIFLICLPKKICLNDFKIKKNNLKSIFNISIPTTGSRLIGSIGYFFEPIIFNFILINLGFKNEFIISEYGIINGYVMPLLLLPSFFSTAISQALIPVISKSYSSGNIIYTKFKIKQAIIFSLIIGIPCTLVFLFFPSLPLNIIYKTNLGINYIKFLAPFCLFYYIQTPIISSLQAMNKANTAMKGTLYGAIIRIIILMIGTYFFNSFGLILATAINIMFVTIYQIKKVIEIL